MIVQIENKIVFARSFQGLCRLPFYGHAHGCPNYGKKQGCPPAPLIDKVIDLNREMYIMSEMKTIYFSIW